MKKLLLVAVLLMVVSVASFAGTVSQNAAVTATVNANWTITKLTDMTFAAVNQGVPATIASNVAAATSFHLSGAASSSITIVATTSGLTDASSNPLAFTLGNVFTNANAAPTAATATDGLGTTVTTPTNSNGLLNIYVGGTITPTGTQATGQYTGTITITVTY